jgi:hypothetical protein
MGIGVIELVVVVAVIALIARGIGAGHLLFWVLTIAGVLAVLFVAKVVVRDHLRTPMPPADHMVYHEGGWTGVMHAGPSIATSTSHGRISMFGFLVLLAIPAAMFAVVRRCRHRGVHGLLPLAGAATIALLFGGIFFVRSSSHRNVYVPPSIDVPLEPHAGVAEAETAEAPATVDELWQRLTEPRIAMEGQSDEAAARQAAELAAQRAAVEAAVQVATLAQEKLESMAARVTMAVEEEEVAVIEEPAPEVPAELVSDHVEEVIEAVEPADEQLPIVEPYLNPTMSPARPDWVDHPPKLDGPVQRVVVQAGPYSTLTECHEVLRQEMARVVQEHVQELANQWMGRVTYAPNLDWMGVSHATVVREMLADQFVETTQASVGEMKTAWALLEFDQADDQRLLKAWQTYARRDGIAITAVGSLLVLGALGLVYGLISVDTWTRGYYTKRLFIGVPAAIIGLLLFVAMVAG